jgi:hypothetical protein
VVLQPRTKGVKRVFEGEMSGDGAEVARMLAEDTLAEVVEGGASAAFFISSKEQLAAVKKQLGRDTRD